MNSVCRMFGVSQSEIDLATELHRLRCASLDFVRQVQTELLSKDENLIDFHLGQLERLLGLLDPSARWQPVPSPNPAKPEAEQH